MRLSAFAVAALIVATSAGCSAEASDPPPDESVDGTDAMTNARVLKESEMIRVAVPAGYPQPWDQPDSDGIFDEKGKCGPTAVANALKLYGRGNVSPEQAYEGGVQWVVGSLPVQLSGYLNRTQPDLHCAVTFPPDGPAFLRAAVATGRPVMVWYRTEGMTSHWVTVAGIHGSGVSEGVVVMSWGRYYRINMQRFEQAWSNVYGFVRPSVVCGARTNVVHAL